MSWLVAVIGSIWAATAVAEGVPAFASGATHGEKLRVGVVDLGANGVKPDLANTITSMVALELNRLQVFSVISNQEIRAMLSHEAAQQLVGCENNANCGANVGAALGVQYLVSGSIGNVGSKYTLNLVLTDIKKGSVEGRASETVDDSAKLIEATSRSSKALVSKILGDRQGFLLITCSEKGATVKIDDQIVGTTPLPKRAIGWGPHLLQVEKEGFVSAQEDISVQGNGLVERNFSLIPSPDFLNNYEASAKHMRIGAWITTGAAVLAFGGAIYFQVDHTKKANDYLDARRSYEAEASPSQAQYDALVKQHDSAISSINKAYIFTGVGAALTAGAIYFWIAGSDPDRYARYREVAAKEAQIPGKLAWDFFGPGGLVSVSTALP